VAVVVVPKKELICLWIQHECYDITCYVTPIHPGWSQKFLVSDLLSGGVSSQFLILWNMCSAFFAWLDDVSVMNPLFCRGGQHCHSKDRSWCRLYVLMAAGRNGQGTSHDLVNILITNNSRSDRIPEWLYFSDFFNP